MYFTHWFLLFQYSPLAPVYADNLVAAMATAATTTATTVSDDTAQQNSPNQAAEEGEGLELMEDKPPLTGVYMCVYIYSSMYTKSIACLNIALYHYLLDVA